MAEDEEKTSCCPFSSCFSKAETNDDERKPLLPTAEKKTPKTRKTTEEAAPKEPRQAEEDGKEMKGDGKEKKPQKPEELKFEKFQIVELDTLFDDFARALNPFVRNRKAMETAETSFKEAVASFANISLKAKFREYLEALKTKLKEANIILKVKGGVLVVVSEAGKTTQAISRAVTAGNRILAAGKDLKAMPTSVEKATEDALVETEDMDIMAILKGEFSNWWDTGKIIKYKKAFAKNVRMLEQAPGMVKEFCNTTRALVAEIYRAFADEDEEEPYSDEEDLQQDEVGEKDEEEDNAQSDTAEGAVGGENKKSRKKEKTKEKENGKEKENFHRKLEFKVIGVQDIDAVFADLALAINPFIVTRESIQKAKEAFENSVKQICNFEGKREFKEYVKELKEKAKKGGITIYIDTSDGEVKIDSIKGLEPPKIYRDALKALNNLKNAGIDALQLEPHVQRGIVACARDVSEIEPKRDIKKGLKFKDLPKLVGKVMDLNENRKKVQKAPGIVKEFCQYVDGLITDVLEALVEGKARTEDEEKEKEGNRPSDEEKDDGKDKEEGEEDKDHNGDEDKETEKGEEDKDDDEDDDEYKETEEGNETEETEEGEEDNDEDDEFKETDEGEEDKDDDEDNEFKETDEGGEDKDNDEDDEFKETDEGEEDKYNDEDDEFKDTDEGEEDKDDDDDKEEAGEEAYKDVDEDDDESKETEQGDDEKNDNENDEHKQSTLHEEDDNEQQGDK